MPAQNSSGKSALLSEIKSRYQEIIDGLELSISLEEDFGLIEENFKKQIGEEYAASRGEFLNGKVMADYLGFEFVDAARIIRFDGEGQFDAEMTNRLTRECLKNMEYVVVPGFYGAMEDGTQGAVLTLPVPLSPGRWMWTCMRTGQTYQDFS